ncbi:hypothetical protein ACJJTC_015188 [Scirpophaga incertulas]
MGRSECNAPKPAVPPPAALAPATEWRSLAELDALSADIDALRTQALLVAVRVLGAHHKDTLLRIMHRGASYADAFRYQKCIDLWVWALELRIQKDTLLYTDTYHTACAITRLMLDALQARLERADGAPRFQDVLRVLALLARQLPECRRLLSRRPVHKKQGEAWGPRAALPHAPAAPAAADRRHGRGAGAHAQGVRGVGGAGAALADRRLAAAPQRVLPQRGALRVLGRGRGRAGGCVRWSRWYHYARTTH